MLSEIEIDKKIRSIIAEILIIDPDIINDQSTPRSIESWKGLNHRKIIEALEKEFNINFDISEKETLVNYKIIKATVLAHLEL